MPFVSAVHFEEIKHWKAELFRAMAETLESQ
jgi:hypothetical protein